MSWFSLPVPSVTVCRNYESVLSCFSETHNCVSNNQNLEHKRNLRQLFSIIQAEITRQLL